MILRLYLKYASITLRSAMQHKASFLMMTLGQFLVAFSAFIGIYFLMQRFNSVSGFSYNEVLLCFGTVMLSFSIAECFARGFDQFRGIISNGEFDRIMVRPRNEMLQVLGSRIEFSRLGRQLQAIVVFLYAIPASGIDWTADKVFVLCLMILGGVGLFSGLFIIYASICFFTIEGLEFMNVFTDGGREFGSYPIVIYGEGVLCFLTYVVPLALVQYYPLLYLIGRSNNLADGFLPLAGILFIVPSYVIWRIGIKHYKSVGS